MGGTVTNNATITLDGVVGKQLTARRIPLDHPPNRWPTEAGQLADVLAPVRAEVLGRLWGEPGWVEIDTGLADRDDDELAGGLWNLFAALCLPVPQYRTGELVHSVAVADHPADAASVYSQTDKSGAFHTDGTLLDATPELAMLAGISAADEGGETVIVDGCAVAARLHEESPELLAVLERPHPFHSGDEADPVMTHRIVDRSAGTAVFRYNPRYLELGYSRTGQPRPDALAGALDALTALTEDPWYQAPVLIARGHALLWQNMRCLHGRRAFTEQRQRRHLLRVYGVRFPDA
jgi:alpha-ketoglutarate-dependent taurine dioxygenase